MANDLPNDDIANAREELGRIDLAIVALVAARLDQARAIGELKRAAGIAMHAPAQEEEVLRRVEERAESLGVDAGVVRDVIGRLIEAARTEQLES